jgi:hypothetical protein
MITAWFRQVTLQEFSFSRMISGRAKSIVFVNEKEKVFIFFNSTMSLRVDHNDNHSLAPYIHEESREQTALVFFDSAVKRCTTTRPNIVPGKCCRMRVVYFFLLTPTVRPRRPVVLEC